MEESTLGEAREWSGGRALRTETRKTPKLRGWMEKESLRKSTEEEQQKKNQEKTLEPLVVWKPRREVPHRVFVGLD